jgi:radical SAM superfamily enzyme YgiQ (UPF0313 family)
MRKLLIILPDARIHRLNIGPFRRSFREAPLTATTLAALVPDELDFEIQIVDESIDKVPMDSRFDLVAISCLTGTVNRAYDLAKHFKNQGATIVLGGVHVTLLPEESKKHADAILTGSAETAWPELLVDFTNNKLKKEYHGDNQASRLIRPRRELQRHHGYMIPNVVNATRGCKGLCDFCAVPAAGFGWHTYPINEVVDEIASIRAKRIVFNDVSMGEDIEYFKELLKAMIPLKKKWGGLVSTKVFRDPEVLQLLKDSGCVYLLIGFESINNMSLQHINKGFNRFQEYRTIIDGLHSINVILMGCFIFGFDEDDTEIFEKTVDFVNDYQIDIPRYAVYTPYPKTESFYRFKKEERLLHENWKYYDTQHVVFKPKNMSPEQLDEGFKWAYKKTFKVSASFKRTIASGRNFPITFAGNLAYRIYLKRIFSEENRICSDAEMKSFS